MIFCISVVSDITSFLFLILLIWALSRLFLVSLAKCLSMFVYLFKENLLVSLIFSIVFLTLYFIYFFFGLYNIFPYTNFGVRMCLCVYVCICLCVSACVLCVCVCMNMLNSLMKRGVSAASQVAGIFWARTTSPGPPMAPAVYRWAVHLVLWTPRLRCPRLPGSFSLC